MVDLLQAALGYAAQGIAVFPCDVDKSPLTQHGFHAATTDPATITRWWTQWPNAIIGVSCGDSRLAVVDIDVKNGAPGMQSWAALTEEYGQEMALTRAANTPSGGLHLWYRMNGRDIRSSQGKLGLGIDVKALGGYVIAPPSAIGGKAYTWLDPDSEPITFPDCLADLLDTTTLKPHYMPVGIGSEGTPTPGEPYRWLSKALDRAGIGARNDTGFWLASQLRDNGVPEADAEPIMRLYAQSVPQGDDPYTESEALASLSSAYTKAKREPARPPDDFDLGLDELAELDLADQASDLDSAPSAVPDTAPASPTAPAPTPAPVAAHVQGHLTDVGNAQRLVRMFGHSLRFVYPWGWLSYDGKRWRRDESGVVMRCAKQCALSFYRDASSAADRGDSDQAKLLAKHAASSQSARAIKAMVEMAQSEQAVVARAEQFDADPWLLNVDNGTIDLRTGTLRPHRREDLLTKLCPVAYDPKAKAPTWEAFQQRITDGDHELIAYKQRMYGYAITGDVGEQAFFIAYGSGSNGKSTEVTTVREVLGEDFAWHAPSETLVGRREGGIPNDLAQLRGMRLVTAAESDAGRRLAEGLIKQLTGGDPITARFMRQEYFTFRPTHKLILATNHKPEIWGSDHAMWRRIKLIPYTVTIRENEKDPQLPQKLLTEAPGILNWLVQGCLEWQRMGLPAPTAVYEATSRYRAEQDVLAEFISDCCVVSPRARVGKGKLFDEYSQWCEANKERPLSKRTLGDKLRERGIEEYRGHGGVREWQGIGLIVDPERPSTSVAGDTGDVGDANCSINELVKAVHEQKLEIASPVSPTSPAKGISPDVTPSSSAGNPSDPRPADCDGQAKASPHVDEGGSTNAQVPTGKATIPDREMYAELLKQFEQPKAASLTIDFHAWLNGKTRRLDTGWVSIDSLYADYEQYLETHLINRHQAAPSLFTRLMEQAGFRKEGDGYAGLYLIEVQEAAHA